MNAPYPFTFQPQPPSYRKTTGGKQGLKAPIPASFSDDEDIGSVADHTFAMHVRSMTTSNILSSNQATLPNLNPHKHCFPKKHGAAALDISQISSNNNNNTVINLNHVTSASTSNSLISTDTAVKHIISCGAITFNNEIDSCIVAPLATTNNLYSAHKVITSPSPLQLPNGQSNCEELENLGNLSTICVSCDSKCDSQSSARLTNKIAAESSANLCEQSESTQSIFAYEHDHDYDSVGSPCSSTASGPIYVRPAGFKHHAQEIEVSCHKNKLKKKKCPNSLAAITEGNKKRDPTPPKLKPKKDPLPMKLRALPQSFWQQPNVAHQVSPATLFLPPLLHKDSEEILMDMRPLTPTEDKDVTRKFQPPERKVTVTNTDLLLKLFEGAGEGKKTNNSFKSRAIRIKKQIPKSNTKGLFLGNDPYMVDAVTENIFPQLILESSRHSTGGGNTSLHLITLKEGDKIVTLPSLTIEQNYPQMLSELVMHI